jgi:phosphoribosyl-ATP pyrophosphohydrolase/phosphoribosyl-AMP cyclohydrolase
LKIEIDNLKFDRDGLIPAVVQDAATREVLTLAFMNTESIARTIDTGQTWFWSRSRQELWHKGETSGNTQDVVELLLDCDRDALVVLVNPAGPACHTGARSCFQGESSKSEDKSPQNLGAVLDRLYAVIQSRRRERPEGSYTTYLFNEGLDKILKKVGEESAETIIAAKNSDSSPLVSEVSDLIYHLLVLLVERGVSLNEIRAELHRRANGGSSEAD